MINYEDQVLTDAHELRLALNRAIESTPVVDMHTHLFAPPFGALNLWGIDELLTYHYLIAELFRHAEVKPAAFWSLARPAQADLIWQTLFVENTPLSEATRGVVTVLAALGLDTRARDLTEARAFFREQRLEAYLDRVLGQAGVSDIVMTNDPLDPAEAAVWQSHAEFDPRFHAALRIDPLLNEWETAAPKLAAQGFRATAELSAGSLAEARRFLTHWAERMRPLYFAVSLPDSFAYPEESPRATLIREVVLPVCRELDVPFALMIGVRRGVNPVLRVAGDGVGRTDLSALERLCVEHPENRFLVSVLSRENQHELCVTARKFANLMPFGCWWFLNNPSIITEITAERVELLGTSFIPQHSDARILDQLIYKWSHSRRVIAEVLYPYYAQLITAGRGMTRGEIERDVEKLLAGNFRRWVGLADRRAVVPAGEMA